MTALGFLFLLLHQSLLFTCTSLAFISLSKSGSRPQSTAKAAEGDGLLSESQEKAEKPSFGEKRVTDRAPHLRSGVAVWVTVKRPSFLLLRVHVRQCLCACKPLSKYHPSTRRRRYRSYLSLFLHKERDGDRNSALIVIVHRVFIGAPASYSGISGSTGGNHNRIIFRPQIHHS